MNIHNAPADMDYYAGLTDGELAQFAIGYRNEILDELRRREETMEAKAEGRYGTYDPEPWSGHIPTWHYAR